MNCDSKRTKNVIEMRKKLSHSNRKATKQGRKGNARSDRAAVAMTDLTVAVASSQTPLAPPFVDTTYYCSLPSVLT